MKKTTFLFVIWILALGILLPVFVQAAPSWWPLVPCGTSANPTECTRCDLFKLFKNIIDFVLVGLMPPVAAILFVWGGFLILMGGANPGWISQGRTIFWNTFMGVLILSSSWLITNTIIKSLAEESITNPNVPWYQFECRETVKKPPVSPPGGQLIILTGNLPNGTVNQPYNQTVQVSGGVTPYAWTQLGSLPAGMSFNAANGQITGTPTTAGTSTFTVKATDNSSPPKSVEKQFSITVNQTGTGTTLSIPTSSLSDATQNQSYSQTVIATGGQTPYNWSVSGGAQLPSGLFVNASTGEIFGKPTTLGNFTFTVGVQDSSSPVKSATKQLSIKVVAPGASVAISNVASSNITNTSAIITWTTDKPSTSQVTYGITTTYGSSTPLNSSRVISHSVTITGLSPGTTYNYQAISSITGFTARSSNYTFKTTGTPIANLTITTTSLSGATQGQPYSQTLSATGGKSPYNWSISSGNLPAGLGLSSSGTISGKPTIAGTSTFTVRVTDNSTPQQSATKQLSIVVGGTAGVTCKFTGVNLCQASNRTPYNNQTMVCGASACSQYVSAINQYAGRTGMSNGANFLKAIMIKESACNAQADSGHAQGLMQLKASTANIYKNRCGVSENITAQWLKDNPTLSICIAAEYMRALTQTSCGGTPRNIAAGYNGGSGACQQSSDCAGETSCAGDPVKRWECLYDNPQHTVCNDIRPSSYDETRDYAVKVLYCYNNPGF